MAKFRKKPVVIDAIQWTGDILEMETFASVSSRTTSEGRLIIPTLEGEMTAQLGDWIIKGIKGECYPCKPDIFAATYEEVHDE